MKDNALIARFMGGELLKPVNGRQIPKWDFAKVQGIHYGFNHFKTTELAYDRDWNWLMQALHKFDTLPRPYLGRMQYEILCDNIDDAVTTYNISAAYKELVKGIKWYNKQQKLLK